MQLCFRWRSPWPAVFKMNFSICSLMSSWVTAGSKVTLHDAIWIFNWLLPKHRAKIFNALFLYEYWKIHPFQLVMNQHRCCCSCYSLDGEAKLKKMSFWILILLSRGFHQVLLLSKVPVISDILHCNSFHTIVLAFLTDFNFSSTPAINIHYVCFLILYGAFSHVSAGFLNI